MPLFHFFIFAIIELPFRSTRRDAAFIADFVIFTFIRRYADSPLKTLFTDYAALLLADNSR
jgi:hypothetical protein